MIAFKPVALRRGLGQPAQPVSQMPTGPATVSMSAASRKTLPMIMTGVSALLTGAAAWGNKGRKTEDQKTVFMMTAGATALSAAAFLFFLLAPE